MDAGVAPVWLAAVVSPWAIAPHPNFSVKECSAAELLALSVDHRHPDRQQYFDLVSWNADWERDLVSAGRNSLFYGAQVEAISTLRKTAADREVPIAARAAAALLMSVALADLDRPEQACEELASLLEDVDEPGSASRALVAATIRQQLAMRLIESGHRDEARHQLERVSVLTARRMTGFERLKVSRGTAMTSSQLQNEIRAGIARNAHALLSYLEPIGGNSWVRLVRERNSWLRTRGDASALRGSTEFINEAFDFRLREVGRPRRWTSETVSNHFERSLIAAELSGDFHAVNTRREQLAQIRVSRADQTDSWAISDAIGLLRRGDFKDTLDATIRWARAAGPLESLATCSDELLRRPSFPDRIMRGDVALLSGAAELLDDDQAARAIDAIMNYMWGHGRRGLDANVVAEWSMKDIGLRALAKIIPQTSDRHSQVASATLEIAKTTQHLYAMSGGITAVVRELDWASADNRIADEWLAWARSVADNGDSLDLVLTVFDSIRGAKYTKQHAPRPTGLALGARLLLEQFRGLSPEPGELDEASAACVDVMERERESVKRGVRHLGGYSEAEIATAIVLEWPQRDELWEPIVNTLTTPLLGIDSRSGALDRLSRSAGQVPDHVVEMLRTRKEDVLSPGVSDPMFGAEYQPPVLPSAVRALAALGALEFAEGATWVAQLAAMPEAKGRREASRTAGAIAANWSDSVDWALIALMQLAHDQDPVVSAAAGRALTPLLRFSGGLRDSAERVVDDLLQAPGLVIPLSTLRGIEDAMEAGASRRPRLIGTVAQLAHSHAARSVREVAAEILEAWSDG